MQHDANDSDWSAYSRFYDLFYADYQADILYLLDHWRGWRSVLEIGAGTGRLTSFFEKQGVSRYVGFDTSGEMLDIALREARPPGFQLIRGDLLEGAPGENFDLCLYAFNTANYILEPAQLRSHLRACASHLRQGGEVFLDLCVPFAVSKNENDGATRMRERAEQGGAVYELHDRRRYDPDSRLERREHQVLRVADGERRQVLGFQTERRYYPPEEVKEIAAGAGLKVAHVEEYGSGYVDGFYVFLS